MSYKYDMSDSFQSQDNVNFAQDYYPKALNLNDKSKTQGQSIPPQQTSPLSSLFSNIFSSGGSQNPTQLLQLLGGNPLFSSFFSGQANQSDMFSKLMTSFMPKSDSKDEKEKVIDLSNSIEEL